MNNEFKVTINYGISKFDSWIEQQIESSGSIKFIGMGRTRKYNEAGLLISDITSPTGTFSFYPEEQLSVIKRIFRRLFPKGK